MCQWERSTDISITTSKTDHCLHALSFTRRTKTAALAKRRVRARTSDPYHEVLRNALWKNQTHKALFLLVCVSGSINGEESTKCKFSEPWSPFLQPAYSLSLRIKYCIPKNPGRPWVMKFLPAQFPWIWCKCLRSNFIPSKIFNLTKNGEVLGCYKNSDLENTDLRPRKTQTPWVSRKLTSPKTQFFSILISILLTTFTFNWLYIRAQKGGLSDTPCAMSRYSLNTIEMNKRLRFFQISIWSGMISQSDSGWLWHYPFLQGTNRRRLFLFVG